MKAIEKKNNIVLIGMPASGKSTIGMKLAEALGYDFIDTDVLIQDREKARLEELIEEKGIEGFLDMESEACTSLKVSRTVIATGGSVIYREEAMRHLKGIGTVVYLKLSLEDLRSRLRDMKQRGVVVREGQTLADLYLERTQLYEKHAEITVEESESGPEETVKAVLEAIGKKL